MASVGLPSVTTVSLLTADGPNPLTMSQTASTISRTPIRKAGWARRISTMRASVSGLIWWGQLPGRVDSLASPALPRYA